MKTKINYYQINTQINLVLDTKTRKKNLFHILLIFAERIILLIDPNWIKLGKLAGIVEPNDGYCHLDAKSRRYTHGLIQDYPSIGEINYKITQNNVNLIFAVVKDQSNLYKNLSQLIEGSFVGELDDDSSNIVQLVVDIYKVFTFNLILISNDIIIFVMFRLLLKK
jgi:hypothetical protein